MVSLPLSIEATPGTAWLQSTQCAATVDATNSVVGVQPGIANVCVGDAPLNMSAAAAFVCTPATLVNLQPLLSVVTAAAIPAVVPPGNSSTLTFDGKVGNTDDYQTANSNNAGHVLSYALSSLSATISKPGGLVIKSSVQIVNVLILPLLAPLITGTVNVIVGVLTPLLSNLDLVLVPVLQLLGVQIGASTIHGLPPVCGQSQLQY